jgi:hypothetical protein
LTIQVTLENETADQLGLALQGHLSLLRARGFQPTVVYVDPQSGFRDLKNSFPGVLVDNGSASDFAAEKEQAKFNAIQKEIIQVFEELKAITPVMKADVPEDAEVLRCFIFLVEKFLANSTKSKPF